MDHNGEGWSDRRTEAVRELLTELAHVRRVVASFPGERRLRSACVEDLAGVLAAVDPARPLVLELNGGEASMSGVVVHREARERPFWGLLTRAGATGILLAPPISAESLVRFVEVLIESADDGSEDDPIARLRATELCGIEALFARAVEGSPHGEAGAGDGQKARLAAGPTRALVACEHKRVRAAVEQELQRSRPLLAASALAACLTKDPAAVPAQAAEVLLERMVGALLAGHDVRTAAAILEEADRWPAAARESAVRRLEAAVLRAARDGAWLQQMLRAAKREDLQALGVLVLRVEGLLPEILRGVDLEREPRLARELELFARLDPTTFAACAESEEPHLRDAGRRLLARAGHVSP